MTIIIDGTTGISPNLAVTGTLSATGTLSGGTSGTGYSFNGSAPATSLTLDSAGNLGVGGTPVNSRKLLVSTASQTDISINAGSSAYGQLLFGYTGADNKGIVAYNNSDNSMQFYTNVTERMRLNSTGALVLAGGTTSANGIGIAFPATQSASTNANTLDDYEEGSWTPVDSSGASLSFTVGSAIYIKIGRFVLVQFYFTFPITASGASNLIGGLPFTVASSNNYCYGVGRLGTPSAIGTMQANAGGTDIQIYNSSNGIYANSQLSNGNVLASVSYITT